MAEKEPAMPEPTMTVASGPLFDLAAKTDPGDLVGQARVRIFSGAVGCGEMVMAEGDVIGYCDTPTLLVVADDGSRAWWSTGLPREVVGPLDPAALDRAVNPKVKEPMIRREPWR